MHTFQLLYFKALLQAALVGKMGTPFQDFFVDCAKKKWGDDFIHIRPYGNIGDRKCDGRLDSSGRFFQCYAPYAAVENKISTKIKDDFEGALKEWGTKIKIWTFVINDREGLDAASDIEVGKLKGKHPDVKFNVFGPQEFEEMLLTLPPEQVAQIFGVSIDEIDHRRWQFEFKHIDSVIQNISLISPDNMQGGITNPPANKIELNCLSADISMLLRVSDIDTKEVEKYFSEVPDVRLESRVASTLNSIYVAFKSSGLDQNTIFYKIIDALGIVSASNRQRMAGFALIAYFFGKCVIFESEAA